MSGTSESERSPELVRMPYLAQNQHLEIPYTVSTQLDPTVGSIVFSSKLCPNADFIRNKRVPYPGIFSRRHEDHGANPVFDLLLNASTRSVIPVPP